MLAHREAWGEKEKAKNKNCKGIMVKYRSGRNL